MKRQSTRKQSVPNYELKEAVAKWKIYTGRPLYELAGELGIKPAYLSMMTSGLRSGEKYLDRIFEITGTATNRIAS